jgi:hypothetical protein
MTRENEMPTDLFRAAADITRPLGVKKPHEQPALKCYDYDDIGFGFVLHCWYSHEWDEGTCAATIERIELNTGNQIIPLKLNDVPGTDLVAIEALIADQEYEDAQAAAQHLARDDGEYGEYCLNAQRDRLAALEPDESR